MKEFSFFLVLLAAVLDIIANLLLSKSDGFRNFRYGLGAIFFVCAAFVALGQAIKGVDLSIAYATLGAVGILGTSISAKILFGQKLNRIGWAGMVIIICAVVLLKTA